MSSKRLHLFLIIVLAVQLGLVAYTWLGETRTLGEAEPLLQLEADQVSAIEITGRMTDADDEPDRVRLEREGDGWVLASAGDYPVRAERADELVDDLTELTIKDPIATRAANHAALKVGEKRFDRRVKIERKDGSTDELIIGSGASSTLHVRRAGNDDVYQARGASLSSLSATSSSYIDTSYIDVEKKELSEVLVEQPGGKTLTFRRVARGEKKEWTLAELPPGDPLDTGKVSSFVGSLSSVFLLRPIGKEVEPEFGLDQGTTVTLVARSDAGSSETTRYRIGATTDDGAYVKADDRPYVVLVSSSAIKNAGTKPVDDFVKKPEETPSPGAGGRPGMPGGMGMPQMPGGMGSPPGGMGSPPPGGTGRPGGERPQPPGRAAPQPRPVPGNTAPGAPAAGEPADGDAPTPGAQPEPPAGEPSGAAAETDETKGAAPETSETAPDGASDGAPDGPAPTKSAPSGDAPAEPAPPSDEADE